MKDWDLSHYAITQPESHPHDLLKYPPLNGRVPVRPDTVFAPYQFAETPQTNAKPAGNMGAMQESTILSRTFFLPENLKIIQNGIRKGVYEQTNEIITEQSNEQVQIIMRSIFLQHSMNRTDNVSIIREQVHKLNQMVLDYCIPNVVSAVRYHRNYQKDISTLPLPLAYGAYTSNKGSKPLVRDTLI